MRNFLRSLGDVALALWLVLVIGFSILVSGVFPVLLGIAALMKSIGGRG